MTVSDKIDFVAIPSQDADRSRAFYVDALGLRPDPQNPYEFWVGDTCFSIWVPEEMGMAFEPQRLAPFALHADDVAASRAELEAKGVGFLGETMDTGVCHMAFFADPAGNTVILHNRYSPYED